MSVLDKKGLAKRVRSRHTSGVMKLEEFRQEEGLTYAALAERIGASSAKVAERYCKGRKPRDEETVVRIFEATGRKVTPNDWYDLPHDEKAA